MTPADNVILPHGSARLGTRSSLLELALAPSRFAVLLQLPTVSPTRILQRVVGTANRVITGVAITWDAFRVPNPWALAKAGARIATKPFRAHFMLHKLGLPFLPTPLGLPILPHLTSACGGPATSASHRMAHFAVAPTWWVTAWTGGSGPQAHALCVASWGSSAIRRASRVCRATVLSPPRSASTCARGVVRTTSAAMGAQMRALPAKIRRVPCQ
mmetsp:Transcript_74572/g.199560  ORF Transcript_74572/g.199560 Transcript_74572/m.199560 type:complete len:215 (+) Transcript_74572:6836-7480(+)